MTINSTQLQMIILSKLQLIPSPLYRTHKYICTNCFKRCHIIKETNKIDCYCIQEEELYTESKKSK